MPDKLSQAETKRRYPCVSGLTSGTTKQEGRQANLVPTEGSLYPKRLKVGLGKHGRNY